MELKTYRVIVNADDDLTGVYAVSLVDSPAIEVDWIKLGKVEEFLFSANVDKQMLFGPLLIPNKLILRKSADGEMFNIMFDAETIQIIADKYNENKINDIFNFQHSNEKVNAVLLQNWITGKNDKSHDYGFDLPEGTWFAGVKVKDENFWMNEVKTDKVKGFSIEVKADVELIKMSKVKSIIAYRLSKPNSVMAIRECLGCPPNGDGTTASGDTDRRCGGGSKKTAAPKVAKAAPAPKVAKAAPAPKVAKAAPDKSNKPEVKMVENYTNLNGTPFANVEIAVNDNGVTKSAEIYNDRTDESDFGEVPEKALVAFYPDDKKRFDKLSPEDKNKIMKVFENNNERAKKTGYGMFESYVGNTDIRVVGGFVNNQKGKGVYYQYIQEWER